MSEIPCSIDGAVNDKIEFLATNYVGLAGFTILVWDHIDTFAMEVEYIWFGQKSPIVYLFLINRYLTPLGFIVNLFAYLSNTWDDAEAKCRHFIRYEGAMTMIGINIVALMMFIRVYALYSNHFWVLAVVVTFLAAEMITYTWLLTTGYAVPHCNNSGVHACTMVFGTSGPVGSASAWLPLLYDSVVFGLTLHRTLPSLRKNNPSTSYMMRRLLEDGLIYYGAILVVTLILTIMIAVAPVGLKNITTQLELLITVTMMSRITLNLKRKAHKTKAAVDGVELQPRTSTRRSIDKQKAIVNHIEYADSSTPFPPRALSSRGASTERRLPADSSRRAGPRRPQSVLRFLSGHHVPTNNREAKANSGSNRSGSHSDTFVEFV